MRIATAVKRSNRVLNKGAQVRAALVSVMDNVIKPRAVQRSEIRVSSWTHQPQILARKNYVVMRMSLWVHPGGKYKNLWEWTSRGTRKHPISARNAPTLRFQGNYSARTQPGNLFNVGTGRSSGQWYSPQSVEHPGTAARHFEEHIVEEMQPFFDAAVQKAVSDAYARS